jgi:DNA-nicking Smr family endonuclease
VKEDNTIFRVFSGLPDFVRDRRIRLATTEHQEASGPTTLPKSAVDETEDFLSAMKDVRRIKGRKVRIRKQEERESVRPNRREHAHDMNDTLTERYIISVVNLPEYMEGYVDGANPLTIEKLRNGEYAIQQVIDLHGLSVLEGKAEFTTLIAEAVQKRIRCVKIIHGRGLKSRNGPVLKEKLKEWIVRAMHRKWIVAFCSAKMPDGGPGATIILLRDKADKKKLHVIG